MTAGRKFRLWEGGRLAGIYTVPQIAALTGVSRTTVYHTISRKGTIADRFTVTPEEEGTAPPPVPREIRTYDMYRYGKWRGAGTAKQLAARCGLSVSCIQCAEKEGRETRDGYRFYAEDGGPGAGRPMTLGRINQEARDHGMSYGYYRAYLDGRYSGGTRRGTRAAGGKGTDQERRYADGS